MDRSVTIIGFGNQGRAQALNLRSSGWEVTVALRPNSPSVDAVSQEGLPVVADLSSAVGKAEMVALLIPDTEQPTLWRELLAKSLPAGAALVFAHGYNLHFHRIMPRPDLDIILVAPLSSGATLRANFTSGDPTPIAVAVHHDAT
ncbi:MAG: NAD(P)-binding domain-containing protein, partial [Deltaproteobacteria bacterium]|nr:NAD(P)-binding domain-containing protein [Deltaproteobacteria bacterium]